MESNPNGYLAYHDVEGKILYIQELVAEYDSAVYPAPNAKNLGGGVGYIWCKCPLKVGDRFVLSQADKFKAGDVVCLKSGGPLMTVSAIRDNGELSPDIFCRGVIGGSFFIEIFPKEVIRKATAGDRHDAAYNSVVGSSAQIEGQE